MAIVIILMIAFWCLDLPLALQILMTVFGILHCLVVIIKASVKAYNKTHEPRKTGFKELDRFL